MALGLTIGSKVPPADHRSNDACCALAAEVVLEPGNGDAPDQKLEKPRSLEWQLLRKVLYDLTQRRDAIGQGFPSRNAKLERQRFREP